MVHHAMKLCLWCTVMHHDAWDDAMHDACILVHHSASLQLLKVATMTGDRGASRKRLLWGNSTGGKKRRKAMGIPE